MGLGPAAFSGDRLDLTATFAGKRQELLDRPGIRDPFREPLGARGLIFKILDRAQAPPPNLNSKRFVSPDREAWRTNNRLRSGRAGPRSERSGYCTTSSLTPATPWPTMPSASAAE